MVKRVGKEGPLVGYIGPGYIARENQMHYNMEAGLRVHIP